MKKGRVLAILFFTLFLIYGLCVYRDYGFSWDEGIERNSSLITYGYLFPSVKETITDTLNFEGLAEFHEYKDRYYGMAMQLPLVAAEHLAGFTMDYQQIYYMRHLYVFLWFWAASVCFYFLCRRFVKKDGLALVGVALLILSPRILADSFYNIKDSLELSLYIISAWLGIRFLDRPNWKRMMAFAFMGALCTNARIVGAIVIAACLAVGIVRAVCQKGHRRDIKLFLGAGVCSIIFYIALSPITWENPVQGIIGTMERFSSYSSYTNGVWFMGNSYSPSNLPWYYLPAWILATTPVITLILLTAGIGTQLFAAAGRWKNRTGLSDSSYNKIFMGLLTAVPLLYAIIRKPVLYNGWRHMYFLYPFLAFFAFSGFCFVWSRFKKTAGLVTALGLFMVIVWIIRYHPYEYAYFNAIGRVNTENNFEQDYWGVTQTDALQYICDQDSRDYLKVWMYAPDLCRYLLDEADQKRVIPTTPTESADYLIVPQSSPGVENSIGSMEMFEVYHEIKIEGRTLCTIYRKKYEIAFRTRLKEDKQNDNYLYTVGNVQFTCSREGGNIKWIGKLDTPMSYHKIAVDSNAELSEMKFSISEDGENWIWLQGDDEKLSAMQMQYICFEHKEVKEQSQLQVDITVYRDLENIQGIVEQQPILTVTASANADQAPFATDKDSSTRWESVEEQREGMYYEIELRQPLMLSAVLLDTGGSSWDYPRALELWGSEDGENWNRISYMTGDNELYTFSPVSVKYMRFILGAPKESVGSSWSIYEIELYQSE